ncbi:MAG: restriction endonuclease [Anaerolineales bacterium]|nr:restriction endonuclease [Anaerolineales bacterium]
MRKLTLETLKREAQDFSKAEARHKEKSLFGVTDGKAVGTYLEHKFKARLRNKYILIEGNSPDDIDFPSLHVDLEVTAIAHLHSSFPFKSARQKVYGLGHSLLVFVYKKNDDRRSKTSSVHIPHVLFLDPDRTADFYTTKGITDILNNEGNKEDVMAFIFDSRILFDYDEAEQLASEILSTPPKLGFTLAANDLRRRLKYFGALDELGQKYSNVQVYRAL